LIFLATVIQALLNTLPLEDGSLVTIDDKKIRIQKLPVKKS
jgi:hypothetical protein